MMRICNRLAEHEVLLVVNAANRKKTGADQRSMGALALSIIGASESMGMVALQGPDAASAVEAIFGRTHCHGIVLVPRQQG